MKSIGIFGGAGMMGRYFAATHKKNGFDIAIYDTNQIKAEELAQGNGYKIMSPLELAATSDIVVFSVPLKSTPEAIRQYAPHMRPEAALVELASKKGEAVRAAIQATDSRVEIVSFHYNFRPDVELRGKKVIAIPIRPNDKSGVAYKTLTRVLYNEGADVKEMDSYERHDKLMAIVQGMAHLKHMVSLAATGELLKRTGITLDELMQFSTAFFDMTFDLDARIAGGNPGLYSQIQLESEGMTEILQAYLQAISEHADLVRRGDAEGFLKKFQEWKQLVAGRVSATSTKTSRIFGEPIGIELYFQKDLAERVRSLVRKDVGIEDYKANLVRARLPTTGLFTNLKRQHGITLAELVFLRAKESSEGQYAFHIRDGRHPDQKQGQELIVFSPFFKKKKTKDEHRRFRVQMFNSFHDPFLNLFDTWERSHRRFPRHLGRLIAYKITQ